MSGFDPDWLALREPADRAARDAGLVARLRDHVDGLAGPVRVLDIGCGTGSTYRALAGSLPETTTYTLLDHDPRLLAVAADRIGAAAPVTFCRHDLNDIAGLPLDGVQILTASALFDLCSMRICHQLAERLAERGCGFYTALTFNGDMRWSDAHSLDDAVVNAFNRHQTGDKGLGPALGHQAIEVLATAFERLGYGVTTASSPWRLTRTQADLQRALIAGFAQPLQETGLLDEASIEAWIAHRFAAIDKPDSQCWIGHRDILALPPKH